jgi:hypothetical protein
MREHNFQLCQHRQATDPTKEFWECKLCDSIVEFPKGMDIRTVNRLMANRMACLEPMVVVGQTIYGKKG